MRRGGRGRYLLDTHVVLWWLADEPALSDQLRGLIEDELEVYVSTVVVWEVAIKQSLGKLTAPVDLAERIAECDFYDLPIDFEHALESGKLPPIHRDPFDRMLVAQARRERLTLVTRDENIQAYDVPVLVA